MAGREELYLKHIDENTASIAKSLKRIADVIEEKDAYEKKRSALLDFASYYSDSLLIKTSVENYISLINKGD